MFFQLSLASEPDDCFLGVMHSIGCNLVFRLELQMRYTMCELFHEGTYPMLTAGTGRFASYSQKVHHRCGRNYPMCHNLSPGQQERLLFFIALSYEAIIWLRQPDH
jgi:hypothetical protein